MKTSAFKYSLIMAGWLTGSNVALSQQATEVYIPISESPGVSGRQSLIGVIQSVDRATRSIEVSTHEGLRVFSTDERTLFFLDRSKQRRINLTGSLLDCEAGQIVEVKFSANDNIEWIKIEDG